MLFKLKFSYSAQVLLSKVFMVFCFNISPVFKRHRHLSFIKCNYVNMVQYPLYILEGDFSEIMKRFPHCQIWPSYLLLFVLFFIIPKYVML